MIASFKCLLSTLLLGAVLHGASAETVVTAPGAGAQWMADNDYEVRWIGAEEDIVDVNLVRGLPDDRDTVLTLCTNVKGSAGVCTAHVTAKLAAGIDYAVAVGKSEYSYSGYFSVNVKAAATDCANSDDETCRNRRHALLLQKRYWANSRGPRWKKAGGMHGMNRNPMAATTGPAIDDVENQANNAEEDTAEVVNKAAPGPSGTIDGIAGGITGPSNVGKKGKM